MIRLFVVGAAFLQGFLSMGFQLVATRTVAPYYGSTLMVWAFIISTFLVGFSLGAIFGGSQSRLLEKDILRSVKLIGVAGITGFSITAYLGHEILGLIDQSIQSLLLGLGISCVALFFLPIMALSSILPIFTEVLVKSGGRGGLSTGLIYGVSTLGNVVGVMSTTFVLIPNLHTSTILQGWAIASTLCFYAFFLVIKKSIADVAWMEYPQEPGRMR